MHTFRLTFVFCFYFEGPLLANSNTRLSAL
jgi:hypothetical protein